VQTKNANPNDPGADSGAGPSIDPSTDPIIDPSTDPSADSDKDRPAMSPFAPIQSIQGIYLAQHREAQTRLLALARALAIATPDQIALGTTELAECLAAEFYAGHEWALRGALAELGGRSASPNFPKVTNGFTRRRQSEPAQGILAELQLGTPVNLTANTPCDRSALDLLLSIADDFACRAQCPDCVPGERRRPMRAIFGIPMALSGPFGYRISDSAAAEIATMLERSPHSPPSRMRILPGLVSARTLAGLRWLPMLHLMNAAADGLDVLDRIPGSASTDDAAGPWRLRFLLVFVEQSGNLDRPVYEVQFERFRKRLEPLLERHLGASIYVLDSPRTAFFALQSGVIGWLIRNLSDRRDRLVLAKRNADHLTVRTSIGPLPAGDLRVEILDDDGITVTDSRFATDGIEQPDELVGLIHAGMRTLGFKVAASPNY